MRKTHGSWGETAPFPKSRASYFRFARFNTTALKYLRAWNWLDTTGRAHILVGFCSRIPRGEYGDRESKYELKCRSLLSYLIPNKNLNT